MKHLTQKHIARLITHLQAQERAPATIQKYNIACAKFLTWLAGRPVTREALYGYKEHLRTHYATSTVNGTICALNQLFDVLGWQDCRLKLLKTQRPIFLSADTELTRAEYERLVEAAIQRKRQRLALLVQTICATGIRISELSSITVEAAKSGVATPNCKGKIRMILLPKPLCKALLAYAKSQTLTAGPVFVTKGGLPLDRSNVWQALKRLSKKAGVAQEKVYPHNLRHLFARTYYSASKDIVRLADLLGHSSIDTTRIYTMESGDTHRKQLEKLGLLHSQG